MDNIINTLLPQKELSKQFWPDGADGKLDPIIRYQLLKIARDFKATWDLKESGMASVKIVDLEFTGSLANFNWSKYSDIDLHLKVDYQSLEGKHLETAKAYLLAQKNIYNSEHNILIKGYEVEVYPEPKESQTASTGIYSAIKDEWVVKPEYKEVSLNREYVSRKTQQIVDLIKLIENQENKLKEEQLVKLLDHLQKKIKKMRQSALDKDGEYAENNLVFKILRRSGYMDKVWSLKTDLTDKELSIKEVINVPIEVGDTVLGGKFKNHKIVVKDIGKNDKNDITINNKPLLKVRIPKKD